MNKNLSNVEKIFKKTIEKKYSMNIGNICYNNYLVNQSKCSEDFTIFETDKKNEIDIGIYNPNLEGINLITIEIINSSFIYKISNIKSDFFCLNNIDNFNYENKCFLYFFIDFNKKINCLKIKIIKTNEYIKKIISLKEAYDNKEEITLIENNKLIKEFKFNMNKLLFNIEYFDSNSKLIKVIFNYYDAIFYDYGKCPSNKTGDFAGCNADHYIFRPTSDEPIPIKIDLNNYYIFKGDLSIVIITDNGNLSYTLFSLFYEPFFIKVDHIFNNLLEYEKINNSSKNYIFIFNSSINNSDENNITKFYTD
jgi:hypothetical protein